MRRIVIGLIGTVLLASSCELKHSFNKSNVSFSCISKNPPIFEGQSQVQRDILWKEVLAYLSNYSDSLKKKTSRCGSVFAATLSRGVDGNFTHECLDRFQDIDTMLTNIDTIVQNSDKAKKCFDPTMSEVEPESFRGLTPSREMKSFSSVAAWLDRETFAAKFQGEDPSFQQLNKFGSEFLTILQDSKSNEFWLQDPSIKAFPHLWASAPWIPMYVKNKEAGAKTFRGGYAYAEILGPWGMLRIDTINGAEFQAEVGITNQRSGSYYPPHYHYAAELYFPLSSKSCENREDEFLLIPRDSQLALTGEWKDDYDKSKAKENSVIYINRNYIHSFAVADCKSTIPTGMVTAWSRTIVRDGLNQTTNICKSVKNIPPDRFTKSIRYNCQSGKVPSVMAH